MKKRHFNKKMVLWSALTPLLATITGLIILFATIIKMEGINVPKPDDINYALLLVLGAIVVFVFVGLFGMLPGYFAERKYSCLTTPQWKEQKTKSLVTLLVGALAVTVLFVGVSIGIFACFMKMARNSGMIEDTDIVFLFGRGDNVPSPALAALLNIVGIILTMSAIAVVLGLTYGGKTLKGNFLIGGAVTGVLAALLDEMILIRSTDEFGGIVFGAVCLALAPAVISAFSAIRPYEISEESENS